MAVNTAARRRAFQSAAWAPQLPFPDGELSSADRFSIQGITAFYAGEISTASGLAKLRFSASQPEVTFTFSAPTVGFTAKRPKITFSDN